MKVPPAAVINIIRENLNDRYRKGFPILKELVQNADDANATQLNLGWVTSLDGVQHPLLGGPALFVVNDGAFKAEDGEAIDCIGLSSKAGSKFSVGKFGLGLKSIFHVCESFFYIAVDDQTNDTVAHIVNPWADNQGQDEFHQGWSEFPSNDQQAIISYLKPVLGQENFFCLWIPLRRQQQLQGRAPITKDFPGDADHAPEFLTNHGDTQFATLLPMLRSLHSITTWLPDGNGGLKKSFHIQLVEGASRRRYPFDGSHNQALDLNGQIKIERFNSPVVATERHRFGGYEILQAAPEWERLKLSDLWPSSGTTVDKGDNIGEYVINPDKAEPHSAICFSEYPVNSAPPQLSTSLAVFLTVDEPPFKPVTLAAGTSNFALTLHGYFFLDAGRSRIEGLDTPVAEEMPTPADEQSLRFEWNARLFQQGTLPLLLPALQQFVGDARLSKEKIEALTGALAQSELMTNSVYRVGVCRKQQWVFCLSSEGNQWRLLKATESVFEIPNPPEKDNKRPFAVFPALKKIEHLTVRELPRLTPTRQGATWDEHLVTLLQSVPVSEVFGSQGNLDYLLDFLENYAKSFVSRPEVVKQLKQLARSAFYEIDLTQLGSYRSRVQRFLGLIPADQRFVLQLTESLEKSTLFAPAMAELMAEQLDVLLIPSGFDTPGAGAANQISADDAVKLLSRLGKFTPERTSDDRLEELCTVIVLRVIAAVQSETEKAQVLDRCANLALFRGFDFQVGSEVSLRLNELNELLKQKTLFRFANPLANPNTEGETTRLQKALRDRRVVLIRADVAAILADDVPTCTARASIETLALRPALSAADHRVELLTSLAGQLDLSDSRNRRCLRYLLHGESVHYQADDTPLLVGDINDAQNIWARITDCVLAMDKADWQVINRALADNLTPIQRNTLGLRAVSRRGVEELLKTDEQFAEVNRRLQFSAEDSDTLLREILAKDTLKRLKIHETIDGERVIIDEKTYLTNEAGFVISSALKKQITLLHRHTNPNLVDKQQRLAPTLTPSTAIEIALKQAEPGNFWQDVMNALADITSLTDLQRSDLRQTKWLPLAVSTDQPSKGILSRAADYLFGTGSQANKFVFIPPQDVIYLAGLDDEVARLTALDQAFYDVGRLHPELRQHPAFDELDKNRIFPGQGDALGMLGRIMADHADYRLGTITALDNVENLERFRTVFQAVPPELMPAAAIINAVCEQMSPEASVDYLLPHLRQPIAAERTIKVLEFLAGQHIHAASRDKKEILEVHSWYLAAAAKMQDFVANILPKIKLLNQLDEWKLPGELCYNVAGIDKIDLLSEEQGRIIATDRVNSATVTAASEKLVSWPTGNREQQLEASVKQLGRYFQAWEGALERREVVGGLLCLLGNYSQMADLSNKFLGNRNIDYVRDMVEWKPIDAIVGGAEVPGYGQDIHQVMVEQRFIVAVTAADAKTQTVISLTGDIFEARLTQETSLDNLIAGDEHKKHPPFIEANLQINHLCLRQVNPAHHTPERLSALLRATSAWILQNVYWQKAPNLSRVWEELEQSEQLDIQLTQALLLESSFFYLRQLGVQSDEEIGTLLRAWEEGRRQLVQHEQLIAIGRPSDPKKAIEAKQQAAEDLKQLIEENPTAQRLILKAVRSKVRQYQYKPESIPFELFQNADDAVLELEDVTGQAEDLCVVAWDRQQVSLMHWGRPINEFRFGDFDGRDRGYDRDLEKMLVLSYSDKMEGEVNVTGKFGLGFKSAFLITDEPRILSGRLGFRVVGGLYPQRIIGQPFEELQARISRETPGQHQRGTLFELPATAKFQPDVVMDEFKRLVHIMLVFSKRIRRCKIYPGGTKAVEINWRGAPVLNCTNITVGQLQPVIGYSIGQRQTALALNVAEGTLLMSLGARGFERLSEIVPTYWVTAPTQEKLNLGLAINGPFYLDVGRAQLARVSSHNQKLAYAIGAELGTELCQLFAEAEAQWPTFQQALNLAQDATPYQFWESLWGLGGDGFYQQIHRGLPTPSEQEQSEQKSSPVALLHDMLWGTAQLPHGLGRLITEQPALPSHLPGRYKKLTSTGQVRFATTGVLESGLVLDNETKNIFANIAAWPAFKDRVQPGEIINGGVKRTLSDLLPGNLKCEDVSLSRVVGWELTTADKENRVAPETAGRLGQLITPQFMNDLERKASLDYEALRGDRGPLREARFRATDEKHHPARELLLFADDTDNSEPDEQLRAAFAPDSRVLAGDYKGEALQFFKACRQQLLARVKEELTEWALQAADNTKRSAVLYYILNGDQGRRLADMLTKDRDLREKFDKSWLAQAYKLSIWFNFSVQDQEMLRLLLQLQEPESPPLPVKPPAELLAEIYNWWQGEKHRYIERYEEQTYLSGFPQLNPTFDPDDAAERLPWLSLFLLGSFHTMGRQMPYQHRGFLRTCEDKGWLDTFAAPPDPTTNRLNADDWINILEEYTGEQLDSQVYHQWMKQFISIYQLARWLPEYVEIFLSADRFNHSFNLTSLTKSRTSTAFQGSGLGAPPIARTLNLGANFVMRELARNGVLSNPFVHEHCFVPTKQIRDFFERFEDYPRYSQGSVDDSRQIHKYLVKHLGEEKATFDLSFDLPFRYWNTTDHQFSFYG